MSFDAARRLPTKEQVREIGGALLYYCLIAMAVFLFLFVVGRGLKSYGWDARVFCSAGQAIGEGGNPYLTTEGGPVFSINYLPIYVYGFYVACSHFAFMQVFVFAYVIFLLLSLEMWVGSRPWLYGLVLGATGLYTFGWVLRSGNLGSLELLFVAAAAWLLLKNRNNLAFFVLGLITSLKLLPIFYWPLFIALVPERKPKLIASLWGLAGLLLPALVSLVTFPTLIPWFFIKSLGLLPGVNAPVLERGGINNPTLASIFRGIFSIHLEPLPGKVFGVVLFVLLAIASFYVWRRIIPHVPSEQRREFTLALGIVATTLFLPRLKPYSLMPALLFVFVLTAAYKRWVRGLFVLCLSIVPILAYVTRNSDRADFILDRLPLVLQQLAHVVRIYHQPFFLLVALLAIVLITSRSPGPREETVTRPDVQD